ncbi:unnamed protein product [Owenia fusiformis]|uniref:Uncharacterized protein n=1 Tax=Owenia fusiformis TaxID=6347 RepID=A0A8J1UBG4_OWEFU|nr:unnamed protein product [Owenia fusiformis]
MSKLQDNQPAITDFVKIRADKNQDGGQLAQDFDKPSSITIPVKRNRREAGFPSKDSETSPVPYDDVFEKALDEASSGTCTTDDPHDMDSEQPVTILSLTTVMRTLLNENNTQIMSQMRDMVKHEIEKSTIKLSTDLKQLREENDTLKSRIMILEKSHTDMTVKQDQLALEVNHNAQYSRKSTLRAVGIADDKNESVEKCIDTLCKTLNDHLPAGAMIEPDHIEIAHRLPGRDGKPRQIIAKFFDRLVKDKVMSNKRHLKGTNVRIYHDLSPRNRVLLKEVKQHNDIDQAWYNNMKVYGKLKSGTIKVFSINDNIDSVIARS